MKEWCLLIAGEKSGEEHALSFLPALKKLNPNLEFFGVGGDELQAQGMELSYHLKDFSSFGFSEVVNKIPFYLKALNKLTQEVKDRQCKVAILIDFQDFNLKLAKKLAKQGVQILYYVAPQAWAWKAYRAKVLQNTVHTLFSILPFEKKWFNDRGVSKIISVPHPLLINYAKALADLETRTYESMNEKVRLLLLPGSRNDEVRFLLPEFEETVKHLRKTLNKNVEVGIVYSSNVKQEHWNSFKQNIDHSWTNTDLEKAMKWADIALATSGTVTLATGLFQLPTVVAYKGSLLNQYIFETFVKYDKPISLTNLILDQIVFPEFIQERATSFNMTKALLKLIQDPNEFNRVKMSLTKLPNLLSGDGEPAEHMMKAFHLKESV
ncbi:MAG: lipid-A-disaccharide synthase [Bdellovibrionales bacterium CG12_big_fil_rev_8_21_14_0_65_38_15]|nr:MAG: lipid-A-disaccharide synthase [Bdellovibrionales bacterium CG22_combo_CG10-13_8_21_14_all_38_13]PIQ54719.1 MAG: lipid-A-disaccharide synthase [Bdellovibrionales bacterium CG12_big_fil_rev_8_21_14_0_65_38_15]PIR30867.1 MAG: lipid-A-disaccharide synthase [Bdellovibrionales bacterium CG11_big_fil_rev_8_21_14_0_20_38_13]